LVSANEDGVVTVNTRRLAERLNLGRQQVRTLLNWLVDNQYLTQEVTQTITQEVTQAKANLTICNFDNYIGSSKGKQPNKQPKLQPNKQPKINPTITDTISSDTLILGPYVNPQFAEAWKLWLSYRKEIKQSYKTEKSAEIGYNKLIKTAGNNPQTAMDIVENSIANGWKGLFPLPQNGKGKFTNTANGYPGSCQASHERVGDAVQATMDFIARENGLI
jgi:hypothetical protein